MIADCHIRLKNDSLAISNLNTLLSMDPYNDHARTQLIFLYRKTNDQSGLAKEFEQMIKLYGFDQQLVLDASKYHIRNGRYDEAINLYSAYLEYDSTSAKIWFGAGATYELRNDIDQAIYHYYRAIQLAPESENIAEQIYRLCRQKADWDKIINLFTPFLKYDYTIYRLALAEAYLQKSELEQSKEILRPLMQSDPPLWKAYEILGRVNLEEERLDLASSNFQTSINLEPQNPMSWIYLGFTYTDQDSLEAAEKNYRNALNYFPKNPYILSLHGISLSRLERDEDALVPMQKAVKLDSGNVNTIVTYAITLNRLNRETEAIAAFEQALQVDSTNLTALTSLGMLYDQLKMYDKCDRLYEFAIETYPDNDLLLNNYSYSLSERGIKLELALRMAQKAIEAQPDNGAYLDTIGWIYYKMGQYEKALKYIKQSLANREDSPVVVEHLGDVYLKLGFPDEAKIYWRKALQMDADNEELKKKIDAH
jgi:tetratricopeptide (TPR) repeat protein